MKQELSHKDLVKLGRHESHRGYSLSQIEADFSKKGIKRRDAIMALREIHHYKAKEELKAKKEIEASIKQKAGHKQPAEKKSSFLAYAFIILLIGILLYLYYSGFINFK